MKIKTIVYLALLGLVSQVSAEEAHAEGEHAEGEHEATWFWSSDAATASEQKEQEEYAKNTYGGVLMSAQFSLQGCAGMTVADNLKYEARDDTANFIYAARDANCKVGRSQTETGRKDSTSARQLTDLNLICPNVRPMSQTARPYDMMPVTFNFPVQYDSLDINGEDFVITLANGDFVRPVCALLDPNNEGNEMNVVTLVGMFGGRTEGTWPNSIRVVGDLKLDDNINGEVISAKGLKLDRGNGGLSWQIGQEQYGHSLSYESGLVMLKATAYEFSTLGELANNHCQIDFPTTTHVIKILFSGTVTKDGIHPLIPSDTALFTVLKPRGVALTFSQFIGLADLGHDILWKTWPQIYETDGDSYVDLCLRLTDSDNIKDIQSVLIQADTVFPERGTGNNIQHMVVVEHPDPKVYPYEKVMESFADKVFTIYFNEVMDIIYIAVAGSVSMVIPPLVGIGLGVGLLFAQAYLPHYI